MALGSGDSEHLVGGFLNSSIIRVGQTVRRRAGSWSIAVHSWLAHLEASGVDVAPHPIGLDAAAGVETLSYIPGVVPSGGVSPPWLWADETLMGVARLVRRFHDAAASFPSPPSGAWQRTAADPEGSEAICHNDLAPWNTVFQSGVPVAFIDWDLAAPGRRLWDIGFALWHFVPLYGDDPADPFKPDALGPRAKRTRLFCDAYGLTDRTGVIKMVVQRQAATYEAIKHGAETGDPAYRRLWSLGAGHGIQRQIQFVQSHRHDLQAALT